MKGDIAVLRAMVESDRSVLKSFFYQKSLLHVAVDRDRPEIIKLLLELGADVNGATDAGWTPLHAAVFSRRENCTKALLEGGADPNAKDRQGRTPLSASGPHKKYTDLLRSHGAKD